MPHSRLQQAFETLMERAPSALFQRARALYLNKYPLDGRDSTSPLRLFISEESLDEQVVDGGQEGERLAVVSIKPITMALVHWQQPEPASTSTINSYFKDSWGLTAPQLSPISTPWFRDGGHQSLFTPPEGLIWVRSSPMPEREADAKND